ncbi:hypothetical protein ACFU5O_03510 [Streptomyces sp. NPDC057445]|uniref:hypothetical protein n=1 Tax=Streptomyces sp. NPDC057445 TaxID=3346136 RepID=UPI0036C2DE6A
MAGLTALAASAVIVAAPLIAAPPAFAQYPPTVPGPGLGLGATVLTPGDDLDFTGTGFEPGQAVTALLLSREVVLGRFTADSQGIVEGTVTIPRRIERGRHTFRLRARNPYHVLSATIRIKRGSSPHWGSGPQLADTGGNDSLVLVGGAAGLVLLGGGTAMAARRRTNS